MTEQGYKARGSKMTYDGSDVLNITEIGLPSASRDTIDLSTLDQDSKFKKMVGDLVDGGELSVSGNLTNAAAANTLYDGLSDEDPKPVVITLSSGLECTFDGIVTGFEGSGSLSDKLTYTATIQAAGEVSLSDATD